VEGTLPNYRKFMKGFDWGSLGNKFKDEVFDTKKLEEESY